LVLLLSLPFYYLIAQKGFTVAWMLVLVPLPVALISAFKEEKGDVGKTTCALNIVTGLNELNKEILPLK
jgi:hypothetical protein